jgi:hypothetical protein
MIPPRAALSLSLLVTGCFDVDQPMSAAEFSEAVEMIALSNRAEARSGEVVQISTDFTIGAAVEDSIDNLRAFYESQAPCAEITQVEGTLTVDFGVTGDGCAFNGTTWTGIQTLTLEQPADGALTVVHGWQGLTDGDVQLDGAASVVWSAGDRTREVVHDGLWTLEGRELRVDGERTERLLDEAAGVAGGIRIDGDRSWTVDGAEWGLVHAGVEVQWDDPISQAGTSIVVNPSGKLLSAEFERQDADTIRLTLSNAGRERAYDVSRAGEVTEVAL